MLFTVFYTKHDGLTGSVLISATDIVEASEQVEQLNYIKEVSHVTKVM